MLARLLLIANLLTALAAGGGCAPWSTSKRPAANYVTVEAEGHHDTDLARKDYDAGRKCMEKYEKGKDGDFAKMEKLLQQSLAHDVRFGPAHHSLGVVYLWQKKLYLAAWEFEYAARLMPDRFEPLNNLGLVYETVGKYDQAKAFYLQAREKAPHQPEVIGNLARAAYRNGDPVDQMRPLLEDVLMADSRPEWRCWAAEKLGLAVEKASSNPHFPALPTQVEPGQSKPGEEELPLLTPPSPATDAPPAAREDRQLALPDLITP